MTVHKRAGAIALMVCLGLVAAPRAEASSLAREAAIEIISRQFPPPGRQIVRMFLRQILDDNRSAYAIADTTHGPTDTDEQKASFFGDTGYAYANSVDAVTPAEASAYSRNKLRGKELGAIPTGPGANAYASMSWKGKVVYDTDENPIPGDQPAPAVDLPDPDIVDEAFLILPWSIEDTTVFAASDGTGSFGMSMHFNGDSAFSGQASFASDVEGGMPQFSGDLLAYADAFGMTANQLSAVSFTVDGQARIPINYSNFFDTQEVAVDFEGALEVAAATVPVPAALILALSGCAGLFAFGWRGTRV